jgi:serine/threonine-protein kinase
MVGEMVGSYRVTRLLGKGGMGVVYAGQHKLLGREAAIKVLKPRYSKDEDMVGRFFNEARASSLIKHPGIVDAFDFGHLADGSAYIIM